MDSRIAPPGKIHLDPNTIHVLRSHGISLSHIFPTHWHGDHIGGVSDLIQYHASFSLRVYNHTPDPTQLYIHDGQLFAVEGATLRAVHTPGHTTDHTGHICFILDDENALFTLDNVPGHTLSVEEEQPCCICDFLRGRRRDGQGLCPRGLRRPCFGLGEGDYGNFVSHYLKFKSLSGSVFSRQVYCHRLSCPTLGSL